MARNNVLRWLDGRGWLVLSGGGDDASSIRAQVIGRAAADGATAYVSFGGIRAEKTLADMEDLGAPSGYLVDVHSEDDETIVARLSDAGIVVIDSEASLRDLRSGLMGAAVQGIETAFQNGAIVLVEGQAAGVFGAWASLDSGEMLDGLEWVESALIIPGITSIAQSASAQSALMAQPSAIAIGVGEGSALALGPDGEVETWGRGQVAVALGADYSA